MILKTGEITIYDVYWAPRCVIGWVLIAPHIALELSPLGAVDRAELERIHEFYFDLLFFERPLGPELEKGECMGFDKLVVLPKTLGPSNYPCDWDHIKKVIAYGRTVKRLKLTV